jgi:hypothetical protein
VGPAPGDPATVFGDLRRGALSGAVALRLPGLGLQAFPPEIYDLADTLEVLDLAENALSSLPEDFGRLRRLRVLFCSGNPFARLPPSLGDCENLSQIGFRGCGLREIPAEALPAGLRWLTLTDNRLASVPDALGRRPRLQKLMLAGNRLSRAPDCLEDAGSLELLRLSANQIPAWPGWLARAPRLAWLALAGNPGETPRRPEAAAIPWSSLEIGAPLGEGASGRVYAAHWPRRAVDVAVKLYKGQMTSDGLPASEMDACLAAGPHANLAGAFGRLRGHPEGMQGLVMPRLDPAWRVLAGPPSLESCSRDVYDPGLRLPLETGLRLALDVARGGERLHAAGLLHGDLYAHNVIWDGAAGRAVLSDFGAASFLDPTTAAAFQASDVRAWGILLEELTARSDAPPGSQVEALIDACLNLDSERRPTLAEAANALRALLA